MLMIVTFITNPARWRAAGALAVGHHGPQPAQRGVWVTGHRWSGRPGGPGRSQQLVVGCVRADSLEKHVHLELPLPLTPDPSSAAGGVPTVLLRQDHLRRPAVRGHDAPACGPGAPLSTRRQSLWR